MEFLTAVLVQKMCRILAAFLCKPERAAVASQKFPERSVINKSGFEVGLSDILIAGLDIKTLNYVFTTLSVIVTYQKSL